VKKVLISVLLSLLLVGILAVPAMSDDITASVTVKSFSSVTITDTVPAGLQFGNLDPGTVKQSEANSPSVTVAAAAENNINVTISISGTDFSDGSHSFAVGNVFWNTSNDAGSATTMSTAPAAVGTLSAGQSVQIYHWLSIPTAQSAGTYSSTFTYTSS
jgi:hypothetical protein